jgi:hypothetical protein
MKGGDGFEIGGNTAIDLYHLQIKKTISTYIVEVNTPLGIWYSLDADNGELQSNGNITIYGDLNYPSVGYVVPNLTGDGIITGDVNVQQIVSEYTQYYHYLCSPVGESGENTAYTISTQFLDNTTHDNVYDWSNLYFNTSFPDWYVYNEAECLGDTPAEVQATYNNINVSLTTQQATWLLTAFGWTSNDNLLTQAIPAGTGVLSRVGFDLTGKVLSWSGTLNNGDIDKILELTTCDFGDGLNFVGNPYATPLDWEQVYSDNNADISPFAYVWTPDPSATSPFGASPSDGYFTVYDATAGTSTIPHPDYSDESGAAANIIAIGQGFFVRALNDNVVLDFNNGQRIGDNYTFLLRESKPKDALQLIVEGEKGKDYTNIYLSDLFVNEFNPAEDALKMTNPGLNLASKCDDKQLMVNRVHKQEDVIEVPLLLGVNASGQIKFTIGNGGFESLDYIALFVDKKLNKQQIITSNFEYSYTANAGDENERFVIKFVKGNSAANSFSNEQLNMFVSNNELNVFAENTSQANISILDASGRMVQHENALFNNNKALININNLSNGIYMVNVQGAAITNTQKIYINK